MRPAVFRKQDGGVDSAGLALTEMFYQAALEPGIWPAALDGLNRRLDAEHSFLVIDHDSGVEAPLIAMAGIDEADVARLLSPDAARMLIPFMDRVSPAQAPGTALTGDQLMADPEFEQTEFYNEILRPMNRYYGLTVWGGSQNPWLQVATCRTRSGGPFLQPEARALEQLFPHLTRAQQLYRRLRIGDDRAAGLTAVIERLADAAIVLDASGRLLIVNTRARQILNQRDGLAQAAGALQAATAATTDRLQNAIAQAATSAEDHGRRLSVPRPSRRLPLLLDVMPIWRLGVPEPGMRSPRVIIFIKEPDAPPQIDERALIETFGLTPRECEIVCLLAGGLSVTSIAARLEIQASTVRQNLKSAFGKTGMHNQAALVALVRNFGR
ncbi:hypothetical protein ACH79_31980 [Bradyrhizobium sp. CCBAU 051011]|nr:hypothetical protein ACH79_31980 [Bradyrhizobium sp. CCBAU 051011]